MKRQMLINDLLECDVLAVAKDYEKLDAYLKASDSDARYLLNKIYRISFDYNHLFYDTELFNDVLYLLETIE